MELVVVERQIDRVMDTYTDLYILSVLQAVFRILEPRPTQQSG